MSKQANMSASLASLHAGEIDFGEFTRRTQRDWQRLGAHIYRAWDTPDGVEEADVVQEMLIAAWHAVRKWNPAKAPLSKYVIWTACDKAKKWIHGQRNAAHRDGHAPSRHPVSMARLGLAPWQEERLAVTTLIDDADRSDVMVRIGLASDQLDQLDRFAIAMLVESEGDIADAARTMWLDSSCRAAYRLDDERGARRTIKRAVRQMSAA